MQTKKLSALKLRVLIVDLTDRLMVVLLRRRYLCGHALRFA